VSNLEERIKEIGVSYSIFELELVAENRKTQVSQPEQRKVKRARKQFETK